MNEVYKSESLKFKLANHRPNVYQSSDFLRQAHFALFDQFGLEETKHINYIK